MKNFFKKLIRYSILGAIVFGGYQANLKWEQEYKPILKKLEEKDPEKYAKMVEEAKSFHINETRRLYRELDEMTLTEVIYLRYEKFLEKRKADKKFKEKSYDEELITRENERKVKLENDRTKIEELEKLRQRKPVKVKFGKWEKIKPWQQRLILREKCIKYFKKEIEDRRLQQKRLSVSKVTTLVSQVGKDPLEVENLCEDMLSEGSTPEGIQNAIFRLKESMNFFYFAQLLNETGIPREMVFPFKDEMKGWTRDYNGS